LIADLLVLMEVQEQCEAEHEALTAAREYLLKKREEALEKIASETP